MKLINLISRTLACMLALGQGACAQQGFVPRPTVPTPGAWYRIVVEGDQAERSRRELRLEWGSERLSPLWLPPDAKHPGRMVSEPIHRGMLDTHTIRLPPVWLGSVRVEPVASDAAEVARLRIDNVRRSVRVPLEGVDADMTACVILAREPRLAPTIVLIHPPGPVVPQLAAGDLVRVARELDAGDSPVNANIVILEDHLNLARSTPPVHWMHHHWIDSPVNGNWRTALLEKLLPRLRAHGEGVLDPCRTVIVGHGPGAWAAWWLFRDREIFIGKDCEGEPMPPSPSPELPSWAAPACMFDACILVNPEPFGFSIVELPPVEDGKGEAAMVGSLEMLLAPGGGPEDQKFRERVRQWIRAEDALIARQSNPRPGLSFVSFERALSTKPVPERIMNRDSGEFDPEVLARWSTHLSWPIAIGQAIQHPWAAGGPPDTTRAESSYWCRRLLVVQTVDHGMENSAGGVSGWEKPAEPSQWGLGQAETSTDGLVSLIRSVVQRYAVGAPNTDRPRSEGCGCLFGS